jgi:hypothetical protein
MSTFVDEIEQAHAIDVKATEDSLAVDLDDGRTIIVPLGWYPRLWYGTPDERSNVQIIGQGEYLHWPDLDEDLTISGLLAGRRSGESQRSLRQWLEAREQPRR